MTAPKLYHEIHDQTDGRGPWLVLLHGGLLTIDLSFGQVLDQFAVGRRVLAIELQGHGHTPDTDREMSLDLLAGDVIGLLDELGVAQTDLLGFSLGGLVGISIVLHRPDLIRRLVLASVHYRPEGYHDEIREATDETASLRMPTPEDFAEMRDAYLAVAPDPDHFEAIMTKTSDMVEAFEGWTDAQLRSIEVPTLLVIGDTDFVRLEHAGDMLELIPNAQLTVLPNTTHMRVMQHPAIPMLVEEFLSG